MHPRTTQPTVLLPRPQHRKVAVSFRDQCLLDVFKVALVALRYLLDNRADEKLKEQVRERYKSAPQMLCHSCTLALLLLLLLHFIAAGLLLLAARSLTPARCCTALLGVLPTLAACAAATAMLPLRPGPHACAQLPLV